jgi:hypothetical protein
MGQDMSQLSDEELDKLIEQPQQEAEVAPESNEEELPQEETKTPEEVQEELPEPEEQLLEEEQEEQKPPSRREQLRIQNLLRKYPDLEERATQQQYSHHEQPRTQALDYKQELEADDEVYQRLEQDRQAYGNTLYQQGQAEAQLRVQQQADYIRWETRLMIDNPKVEKEYPMLDKNSEEFHPAVADALNTQYLRHVGFDPRTNTVSNPNVSYAEFVEANMELVEEIANVRNQRTVQNIAKQTATTGLRPDGGTAKRLDLNKPVGVMSDEELAAYEKTLGLQTVKRRN